MTAFHTATSELLIR